MENFEAIGGQREQKFDNLANSIKQAN